MSKSTITKPTREQWEILARKHPNPESIMNSYYRWGLLYPSYYRKDDRRIKCIACHACGGKWEQKSEAMAHTCKEEAEFREVSKRFILEAATGSNQYSELVVDWESWVLWNASLIEERDTWRQPQRVGYESWKSPRSKSRCYKLNCEKLTR